MGVRLENLFSNTYKEFLRFEDIKDDDKLHSNRIICAFMYVHKLHLSPEKFSISGNHDLLNLAEVKNLYPLTEKDVIYLQRCGVMYDPFDEVLEIWA